MINQQALGEPAAEIVGTDVPKIVITSRLSRSVGAFFDDRSDAVVGEIDERVGGIKIFTSVIAMEIALDVGRQIGIAWFAAVTGGIFAIGHPQAIVLAVISSPDVVWTDLWNLERAQPHIAAELTDEIVAGGGRGATHVIEFVVGQPHIILVAFGGGV